MNFGTILNSMAKECVSLIVEGNRDTSVSIAKNFYGYVKLKDTLRKQYYVYQNLNESFIKNNSDAKEFVLETLSILDGLTFNDVNTYNALLETKFSVSRNKSTDVNYHIARLIKYKTSISPTNQSEYFKSINTIVEHISTVRVEEDILSNLNEMDSHSPLRFLTPKHVVRIAVNKFNKKYMNNLTENDRVVFNILRSNDSKQMFDYHKTLCESLMLVKFDHSELKSKVDESINLIKSEVTENSILQGYDLLSELRRLSNG